MRKSNFAFLCVFVSLWLECFWFYRHSSEPDIWHTETVAMSTAVDIMVNIGLAFNKLNQIDDAIEYLELALDFAKGPEAESSVKIRDNIPLIHLQLANAHYNKGELKEAERHLNIIFKIGEERKLSDIVFYNLYATLCEIDMARHDIAKAKERLEILKGITTKLPETASHFKELSDKILNQSG